MDSKEIYESMQAHFIKVTGLKVGSRVKVVSRGNHGQVGWPNTWGASMTSSLGCTLEVVHIHPALGIRLSDEFNYPFFCLEVIPTKVYVKSLQDIIAIEAKKFSHLCEKAGNSWSLLRRCGHIEFHSGMVKFCGKEPTSEYTWLPEWLEEREC